MRVIVWNMAHKPSNWSVLHEWEDLRDADLQLVCEAPPPPEGVVAVTHGSTIGLEAPLAPDRPVTRRWATAVASKHPLKEITDARVDRYYGELLPFGPSRPGTWTAATVLMGDIELTAVSLYGLMDERSDASVHRSLSELSPIFDHERYGKALLLGGDLNILAGRPVGEHLDRHQAVLARIEAYGLVDCLRKMRTPGELPGCPCNRGTACTHTWTKRDLRRPDVPYQDDYLFASPALAARLEAAWALPFTDDSPSDHTPIVADFRVSSRRETCGGSKPEM